MRAVASLPGSSVTARAPLTSEASAASRAAPALSARALASSLARSASAMVFCCHGVKT